MSNIAPDDYIVNVKAVYVLDMLGISDQSYFDNPESNRSVYREEIEIDAAAYTICFKRGFGYEALMTHSLVTKETSYMLREMTGYFAELAERRAPEVEEDAPTVYIKLTYNSGTIVTWLCNLDRASMPREWLQFRNDVKAKFDIYDTRGDLLNDKFVQYGRRSGEYIYCTVYDNGRQNLGYFLTDDDTIRPGDRVSVPVDDGFVTGVVSKLEYFTAYNVPKLPETLKSIVKKINS